MTGEQIRAARAFLGWKVTDLATASGVSVPTVQRIDATRGPVSGRFETIEAIRKAMVAAGVQFLEAGQVSVGPGVAILQGV